MRHLVKRTAIAALAAGWLVVLATGAAAESPSPSPSASATSRPAAAATASPTATPTATPAAGGVTATFRSKYCGDDYGWFVTNSSDVPHTLTLTSSGPTPTITLQPGETHHIGNSNRGELIKLVDQDGTVLIDSVGYDCTERFTTAVTVQSGSSWTQEVIAGNPVAPAPKHGTLAFPPTIGVRYTPDACFVGTDTFGYGGFIEAVEVTVHVTVLGPAVGCAAPVTAGGSGGGDTSLPLTGRPVAPLAESGAAAVLLGAALVLLGRRRQTFSRGA